MTTDSFQAATERVQQQQQQTLERFIPESLWRVPNISSPVEYFYKTFIKTVDGIEGMDVKHFALSIGLDFSLAQSYQICTWMPNLLNSTFWKLDIGSHRLKNYTNLSYLPTIFLMILEHNYIIIYKGPETRDIYLYRFVQEVATNVSNSKKRQTQSECLATPRSVHQILPRACRTFHQR